jgi:LPXTG-motif cell wall-anchored protein
MVLFMKILAFIFVMTLWVISSVYAEDIIDPGINPENWITADDIKYNPDGSIGVGEGIKYDANGASAGNVWVDKENARSGDRVASWGMTPELTPMNTTSTRSNASMPSDRPVNWEIKGNWDTSRSLAGNTLPQTGPQETLLMVIALIWASIIMWVGMQRRKHIDN